MKKVLIADDEETIRATVGYFLENRGFNTEIATNGREALEKVSRGRPDLILLDINMPEMDGFEACRRLRANSETQAIPIIIFSAQQLADLSAFESLAGASIKHLMKPCNFEELFSQINLLLP